MKIIFKNPKKKKILIFDRHSLHFFGFIFKKGSYEVLDVRYESINFFAVINIFNIILTKPLSILELKNYKQLYILSYIKLVSPKLVITSIDNNIFFYRLKKFFNKICFISVQNGIRDSFFLNKLSKYKKNSLEVDFFFTLNENIIYFLKKKIKSKYISVGNLKNNEYNKKKKNKKKDLVFISQSRTSLLKKIQSSEKQIYCPEFFIFQVLKEFCKKKKVNLILLSKQKKDNIWFKYFKYNKIIFSETLKQKKRYEFLNNFYLFVFISSALGYEFLAKKKKVLCLPFFSKKKRIETAIQYMNIGYPKKYPPEGFFWTNSTSKNMILKKLNKIFCTSESDWLNVLRKSEHKNLMSYDLKNKTLKKIINMVLNK